MTFNPPTTGVCAKHSLPSVSLTFVKVINVPLVRYSTSAAEKTAVRNELLQESFQRQNWLGGMIEASADVVSWQLARTGRTESRRQGTTAKSNIIE